MAANNRRNASSVCDRLSKLTFKRIRGRKSFLALSAAASAVGLLGFSANSAKADTYSFNYAADGSNTFGIFGNFDPTLANGVNWFDLTSSVNGAAAPGAADIAQFDSTFANLNANPVGQVPSFGLTLGTAQTNWGGISIIAPAVPPQSVNISTGVTTAFVMSLVGTDTTSFLQIGSSGITLSGTDAAIAVPVTLGAAQTWNIASVPVTLSTATVNGTAGVPVVTNSTSLTVTGGLNLNGQGANALIVTSDGNTNISGGISDGGTASGITMNGTGVLTLSSASTYTGGTNLNSGTVSFSSSTGLGAANSAVNFGGGTLAITGTAVNNLNNYNINGSGGGAGATFQNFPLNLFISNGGNQFHIPQTMAGTLALTVAGGGPVLIDQTVNSYTGGTTISAGSLIEVPDFASLGTGTLTNNGSLQLNLTSPNTTSGSSAGTGGLLVSGQSVPGSLSSATLTIDGANGALTNGTIGFNNGATLILDESNSAAAVTTAGATLTAGGGILNLVNTSATPVTEVFSRTTFTSGLNVITASGNASVNLGQLNNVVSTTVGTVTTTTINTTVTRAITAFGAVVQLNGPVVGQTSPFQTVSNNSVPVIFATGGDNGTAIAVSGTTGIFNTFSYYSGFATYGMSDWAAQTAANAGDTAYIVPGSAIPGFYTSASNLNPGVATSGNFSGIPVYDFPREANNVQDNIDVDIPGVMELGSGNSAYTSIRFNSPTGGLTSVGQGTPVLQLLNASGLAEGAAILETPNVGANNVIIGDFAKTGSGTSAVTTQDFNIGRRSSADMVIWQNNTLGMLVMATGIANTSAGNGGFTKAGPGIVALTGTNSYNGGTNIVGGTVEIAGNNSLGGNAGSQSNVNLDDGTLLGTGNSTLDNTSFGAQTILRRNMIIGVHNGTLIANAGTTMTVDGNISGLGGLTVGAANITLAFANANNSTITFSPSTGNGNVILSGADTYTGPTNVAFGTLQLDGTSATSLLSIASGATLAGASPSILPSVSVQSGGTLFWGDAGVGALSTKQLTDATGSNLAFAVAPGTLVTTDPITVTTSSGLSLGSLINLNVFQQGGNSTFQTTGNYTLLQVNGNSSAFNISGILAIPNGPASTTESFTNVGGFLLANAQQLTTYGLTTVQNVGANTTDLVLTVSGPVFASAWTPGTGSTYQSSNNWTPQGGATPVSTIPKGIVDTAIFGDPNTTPGLGISAPSTVTLDVTTTAGNLVFFSSNSYTIVPGAGGTASFTLNNGNGPATITSLLGSDTITTPVAIPGGVSVAVNNATDTLTMSGVISGAGSLTMGGLGTLVLLNGSAASNGYTGTTSIVGGTLQLGNGTTNGAIGNNTGAVLDNGVLAFDLTSGTTKTFTNPITGSGGITQDGAGSLVILTPTALNTANTGPVNVGPGTLRIGNANAATLGTVTLNTGGLFDLNGVSTIMTGLAGTDGTVDNRTGTATITLTVGSSNFNTTYAGTLANTSGKITLIKSGTGTLVLAGTDTYTGGTTIAVGGLKFTNNNISPLGTITINSVGPTGATNNGALILGNGVTLSNPIFMAPSGGVSEFISLPDPGEIATLASNVTTSSSGIQYRLGFNNTTATLFITGAHSSANGQFTFLTEGNLVFEGNASIIANTGSGTSGGFGFGRPNTAIPLNVTLLNNASITNLGVGGANAAEGCNVPSVTVSMFDNSAINMGVGNFEIDNGAGANAIFSYNLNGGTLTAGSFTMTPVAAVVNFATAIMNFNGTVVAAGASSTNFLPTNTASSFTMNINNAGGTGGAIFSSNGHNVVVQSVQGFNSDGLGGGFTKLGAGQFVMTPLFGDDAPVFYASFVPYSGPTLIKGGLYELANGNQNGQLANTPYIGVSVGGVVGTDTGSTSDATFLALLTNANAPSLQFGGLALSPADATTNIVYQGAVNPGSFSMVHPVAGSTTSFANMSIGATANFDPAGTTFSPTVYTGTITPANHQYNLGGGGTLELAANNSPTTNPLVDNSGTTTLLAENGGVVWLATTNTYSGATTVAAVNVLANSITGATQNEYTTLAVSFLGESATSPEGSSLGTADPSNPANLTLDGATFQYLGTGDTSTRLFTMTSNGVTLDGSGTGALVLSNPGAEAFSTGFAGPVTVTLTGTFGTVTPANMDTAAVVAVNSFGSSFSPPTGSTLALVKSGTGAWNINGSNGFAGVNVGAGVLQLGADSTTSLGANTIPLTVGGTLDLNGFNASVGLLTGGGVIDNVASSANSNITTGNSNTASTFTGIIQNSGSTTTSLTVAGTANFNLTGNSNTFSGGTTINVGSKLVLTGGNSSTFAAAPIGTGGILDNGSLTITRTDPTSASLSFANIISGSGTVTNSGQGTVAIVAVNSYSGGTTESTGILQIAGTQALGTGTVTVSGGILQLLSATAVGPAPIHQTGGTIDLNGNSLSMTALFDGTAGTVTDNSAAPGGTDTLTLNSNSNATIGNVIANGNGTISVVQNGTGTLILTGANSFNGDLTISQGAVQLGNNTATGVLGSGVGNVVDNSLFIYDRSDTQGTETNNFIGTGQFQKIAASTLTLLGTNTYSGGTTVTAGALAFGSVASFPSGSTVVNNSSLQMLAGTSSTPMIAGNITGTGSLTVGKTGAPAYLQLAANSGAHTQGTVSVATGSTLDITNNKVVLNYGASDPVTAITAALTSGYNSGSWTGTGIASSAAALNPSKFAVGYIDGNRVSDTTAANVAVNQIKIAYTLAGDAFLEGSVGFDDLVVVAQNFGFTGKDWAQGNFNYDPTGAVGFPDLVNVAQNFGFSSGISQGDGGSGLSSAWQSASTQASVSTAPTSVVPEPASIGLMLAGAAGLLARRRRRSSN